MGENIDIATRSLFEPILAFLLMRYLLDLIDTLFVGQYVPQLTRALGQMRFTVPVWMISKLYPSIEILTKITFYAMILITGNFLTNIFRLYSRKKDNYVLELGVNFSSTIFIGFILGLAGETIVTQIVSMNMFDISPNLISGLSTLIITSSIITAIFSLAVLGESNENPYLVSFARKINVDSSTNFIRIFGLLAYLFYARPYVDVFLAENRQYLPYFEWGIITFMALLLFRDLRAYISKDLTKVDVMGKWQKHLQEIETRSDYRIDRLTQYIDNFINKGEKEVLLVYLINLLQLNQTSRFKSADALHDLIYYKPKELELFTFRWNREQAQLKDLAMRNEILTNLLPIIEQLSYRQDTVEPEEEIMIRGNTI